MNGYILDSIKNSLEGSFDVKFRELAIESNKVNLIYIDDLTDSKYISEYIVEPILRNRNISKSNEIINSVLNACTIGDISDDKDAIAHILVGDVVILFENSSRALFVDAKGFVRRGIGVPVTEASLKGPQEGFNEVLLDNISLIRRKIHNENLKFENMIVGKQTNTNVTICYLNGTTPDKLVNYIREKINNLDINFILDINYIEEEFENRNTSFSTLGYSEKPDVISSKILEGKIAIIVDGSASVLYAPFFFIENFQVSDDYYSNRVTANITRCQRLLALFLAVFTPGLYIALTTHHFALIPTKFVFRLSSSRVGVPFPTFVEVILMLGFFQLLREAGVRLPQPTGQALSIVGALILGDAAVGAGLASQSTIVVVSISSIATFLIPNLYISVMLWSVLMVILASFMGLPGFYFGFFILIQHLSSLDSCGYPYLFPLGTLSSFSMKDLLMRRDLKEISNSIFEKDDQGEA
ncbi:spore germination protein [Clostridium sediminicola]|uniref:spore germination protein n=1 Tax=Clostridium sediminicola TaxID=3114879 RepID=UPI0031F21614